jgi:hypothetical protein
MGAFYVSASLQIASVFVLGFPFSVALMIRDSTPRSCGWLLLAPALGATFYFSGGTILHSLGLRALAVFWPLMVLSTLMSIYLLRSPKLPSPRFFLAVVGVCFFGTASALVLNSTDLAFAGLDYFPLTNDDTFSYLGHIDQIRMTGWIEPRISYPAGYAPLIDHAVFTRTPSVIFAADFADILGLETHSAFFLSQRSALPIAALGASAIVMLTTGSWVATALCFSPLVFGNVLLHQILQQFNSSTMGTVVGTVVIALAIWTVRSERSGSELVAGHILAGWSCGTMAMTSMEAHPFYLVAFGLIALIPVARDRQLKQTVYCTTSFVAAYLVASFPLVIHVWPALIGQFVSAAQGHPGDWIASPGFLMQATGVTLTTAPTLTSYPVVPRITSIVVLVVFATAIAVLGRSCRKPSEPMKVLPSDLLALFLVTVLVSLLQAILYIRGSGYGLLKLTDYFAFIGSVTIGVAAFQLGLTREKVAARALIGFVAAYCVVTLVEKGQILGRYGDRTSHMPRPSLYKLDTRDAEMYIYPDLSAESLNLFLYENRYGAAKIPFRESESARFAPSNGIEPATPSDVARMFRVGIAGTTLADITYSNDTAPAVLQIVPAAGQYHLLLPDPHWLAPEGETVDQLRRWLCVSGKFVMFGPISKQGMLSVQLAAGPDLRPDNRVDIYFGGQRLHSVSPNELPIQLGILLPTSFGRTNEAEIRIVGPFAGIRQISVAKLQAMAL